MSKCISFFKISLSISSNVNIYISRTNFIFSRTSFIARYPGCWFVSLFVYLRHFIWTCDLKRSNERRLASFKSIKCKHAFAAFVDDDSRMKSESWFLALIALPARLENREDFFCLLPLTSFLVKPEIWRTSQKSISDSYKMWFVNGDEAGMRWELRVCFIDWQLTKSTLSFIARLSLIDELRLTASSSLKASAWSLRRSLSSVRAIYEQSSSNRKTQKEKKNYFWVKTHSASWAAEFCVMKKPTRFSFQVFPRKSFHILWSSPVILFSVFNFTSDEKNRLRRRCEFSTQSFQLKFVLVLLWLTLENHRVERVTC